MLNALTDYVHKLYFVINTRSLFQWRNTVISHYRMKKIIFLQYLRGIAIKYEYKILSKSKVKVLLSIIYSFFAR